MLISETTNLLLISGGIFLFFSTEAAHGNVTVGDDEQTMTLIRHHLPFPPSQPGREDVLENNITGRRGDLLLRTRATGSLNPRPGRLGDFHT